MFKKLITEEQIIEIENMSKDHLDALIAYGADMYREGLCKGAFIGIAGFVIGAGVEIAIRSIVKKVKKNKQEVE